MSQETQNSGRTHKNSWYTSQHFQKIVELRITVLDKTKSYTQPQYDYLLRVTDELCKKLKQQHRKFQVSIINEGYDREKGKYFFRTIKQLTHEPSSKIIWLD